MNRRTGCRSEPDIASVQMSRLGPVQTKWARRGAEILEGFDPRDEAAGQLGSFGFSPIYVGDFFGFY